MRSGSDHNWVLLHTQMPGTYPAFGIGWNIRKWAKGRNMIFDGARWRFDFRDSHVINTNNSYILQSTVQGLAPNSWQRVLTPNSGHFLCLLVHFWSDSVHTGLNRTGINTYKFRNQEKYSFRSLNIRKREKVHLKYPPLFVFCFLRRTITSFWSRKLGLCGILLFLQILIVRFITVWSLDWIIWEVKQLFVAGIGSQNPLSGIGCQSLYVH